MNRCAPSSGMRVCPACALPPSLSCACLLCCWSASVGLSIPRVKIRCACGAKSNVAMCHIACIPISAASRPLPAHSCSSLPFLLAPWSAFPFLTFGSTKVWALLPGVAEPRCIFSKVAEKRFPSKNEVISRLADALQVCDYGLWLAFPGSLPVASGRLCHCCV